ncbi:hypothetical protein ABMA28_007307 [Loxostege sticticalis]|uniref:Uncharacterized protein n=1 Tax=Loxostege sticticalis TaxID=481309 RepID=A0ABD0TQ73_LOXSC
MNSINLDDDVDFSKICRACLSDSGPFKDLFLVCTPKMYKYCTSVEVSKTDELPKQICQKCLEALNNLFFFKEVAIRSNAILKKRVEKSKVKDEAQGNASNVDDLNEEADSSSDDSSSGEPDETQRNKEKRIITTRIARRNTRLKCAKCERSFQKYENFEAHMRSHFGKKRHIETHTNEKNYGCVQCGKKFAQPGNLKIHLIRHTGIKNIACTLCDMRFYVKSDLYKHMRSHSSDRPYSCDYCDKRFKCKSFQIVHSRTHTGERPYACDICPKRFRAFKDLRNHRMIHTGEKPHKCSVCSQAFIQKCALNRHMKGHRTEPRLTAQAAAAAAFPQWNIDDSRIAN